MRPERPAAQGQVSRNILVSHFGPQYGAAALTRVDMIVLVCLHLSRLSDERVCLWKQNVCDSVQNLTRLGMLKLLDPGDVIAYGDF